MAEILKLVSKGKSVLIPPTTGLETIASAKEVFHGINMSFNKLTNICSIPTQETATEIYEVIKDSTYSEMLESLLTDYSKLFFTQNQVIAFCKEHSDWFYGWMYIPFIFDGKQRMAYASRHRDEITIHESIFNINVKVEAWRKSRIVVPVINL